jgi:hypothetical protein
VPRLAAYAHGERSSPRIELTTVATTRRARNPTTNAPSLKRRRLESREPYEREQLGVLKDERITTGPSDGIDAVPFRLAVWMWLVGDVRLEVKAPQPAAS